MKRTTFASMVCATLAVCAGWLLPARVASADGDYDYIRQRLAEVNTQIRELSDKIKKEIRDSLPKDIKRTETDSKGNSVEVGSIDMDNIDKILSGHVGDSTVASIVGELDPSVDTTRVFAKERREKLDEYRRPLDAIDEQIAAKQKEYQTYKDNGGGIDLWGMISPIGAYGDDLRRLAKDITQLKADKAKLKKEIDAKIKADPDLGFDSLEKLQDSVTKAYQQYYSNQLPGGVAVKQLVVELGRLIAERDRLEAMLKSGSMFVVWYNDVGWVHVGTMEEFERAKFYPRVSEIWGGLGKEPLKNTLILNTKGYTSLVEAIKAIGKEVGAATKKGSPLASPTSYWVGNVGGAERMLSSGIVDHPAFKEFLPKPPTPNP
jgi:flagellar motility protein MotE (MotC chaperone)